MIVQTRTKTADYLPANFAKKITSHGSSLTMNQNQITHLVEPNKLTALCDIKPAICSSCYD